MNLHQYLDIVNKRLNSGISREHAYRTDLETLIRELVPNVDITNEPSLVTDCGNPDYVITKGKIPIGFIEAKDVGKDLNHKQYKPQFDRYRKALDNLIITDYLWFQFFQNGVMVHEVHIAELLDGKMIPLPDNFNEFTNLIQNFCTYISQTIKSPKKLAEMMAAKARLLENILENALTSDEKTEENTSLKQQYKTFQEILIHDLTTQGFADIYAQTLAYGMFAARLHDPSLDTFSRQEAAELIPKSNPFLRKLFNHVAGVDIDKRIETTVDNLAEVFRATNIEELLKNFGKSTQTQDPIIHFYETFLAAYDPKLRKSRGVWYTPEPVVKFIVRSVDEILKDEFNLKDGLADTTKTKIKFKTDKPDKRTKSGYVEIDKEVHKVQVLDPATGTGTFLAEVIKFIYQEKFKAIQGAWSGYVAEHLIPRLNGFELLMASYSMAHLKLDMLLRQTGYKTTKSQRFNVFLTNSLEEHHPDMGTLFSSWLSTEANEANAIKRDTPVMVVMGNPPYSVSSSNKGEWIESLMADYKKDLKEQNIQPLSDDYLKFIRYGQYLIENNNDGVLAYISNNSFIDGNIHRQVRSSLLNTFDAIYVIDLHGNSNKKETTPSGEKDENVFDIRQGVSITFFIKNKNTNNKGVRHIDLYGTRDSKYKFLEEGSIKNTKWKNIKCESDKYYFVPFDIKHQESYLKYFGINELFETHGRGVSFRKESLLLKNNFTLQDSVDMANDVNQLDSNELIEKYNLKETKDWKIKEKKKYFINPEEKDFEQVLYRPFDYRYTYYPISKIHQIIVRGDHKRDLMSHILHEDNIALICPKQSLEGLGCLVTTVLTENKVVSAYNPNYLFPLYTHKENVQSDHLIDKYCTPNLNAEIWGKINKNLLKEPTPENIFDYIYAVLHAPKYRNKYVGFLKKDFPRIPYPKDTKTFLELVKLGYQLRKIHLLNTDAVENYITSYPIDGDNMVTRKIVKKDWEYYDTENQLGRVWINTEQYFDQIPIKAWEFYIGGYQPAQKWLKSRVGIKLKFDDILHYQKIIVVLVETDRIMKEIDKIDFL